MQTNAQKNDVFICYSRNDEVRVIEIVEKLKKAGIKTWIDINNLSLGKNVDSEIEDSIKSCALFLCFLSQTALGKPGYRHKEIKKAIEYAMELPPDQIYIIPIKLEECEVPNGYKDLNKINNLHLYEKDPDKQIQRLKEQILYVLQKKTYEFFVIETYVEYFRGIGEEDILDEILSKCLNVFTVIKNAKRERWKPDDTESSELTNQQLDDMRYYIASFLFEYIDNKEIKRLGKEGLASKIYKKIQEYENADIIKLQKEVFDKYFKSEIRRETSLETIRSLAAKVFEEFKTEEKKRGFWTEKNDADAFNNVNWIIAEWLKTNINNINIDSMEIKTIAQEIGDYLTRPLNVNSNPNYYTYNDYGWNDGY